MSIKPLRDDQKEVVITTLEDATALSDQMSPSEALAKSAKENGLPYNLLQYVVNAYNTGQSVSNIKSGSTREEKAADVPLATLDEVISHIYPDKAVKKASISGDYKIKPGALLADAPKMKKAAAPREALPSEPEIPDDRMLQAVMDVRDQLKSARSNLNQEFILYKRAQQEIQYHIDGPRSLRLSDLLEQSVSAFGDMAKVVLEPLHDPHETTKSASRTIVMRVDREPFTYVKAAINQLEKLFQMGIECGQAEERAKEMLKKARESSGASTWCVDAIERTLKGVIPVEEKAYEPAVVPVNKKAFSFGKAILSDLASAPGEFGGYVNKSTSPQPPKATATSTAGAEADKKPRPVKSLLDPVQHDEVGSLQKSVALNNLLAANPDLAGYDRGQVERAYNEIQTAFPRVSMNAATLRPFLQRHLTAGGLDEFALKNIADQEAQLAKAQNPSAMNG